MRTIDEINADLIGIWGKRFATEDRVYAPLQYKEPKSEALVFVGLNPSFSFKGWKRILRHSSTPDLDPTTFFQWPIPQNFDIKISRELEAEAEKNYAFFKPHRKLAEALNEDWEHIDLFAYRETAQSGICKLVLSGANEVELTEFGEAQFKLFEEVLLLARPLAVVVINALASKIYLKRRSPIFDSSLGYYMDELSESRSVPVFFSGMLTGARALDRFSRGRLFWQIANALGKPWTPSLQLVCAPEFLHSL